MDLTARDIHEKQFHDSWRGYNQEEVDEFLDRVADVLDRLARENAALNARVTELDHAVATSRDTEEMLKKTLITAQQAAEEAIANAKARAEALIQEAEERTRQVHREADEKLQSADAEARRKSLEADREHTIRKREIDASLEKLRRFESDLKRRLVAFLGEQTRSLERLTEEEPPKYEPPKQEPAPSLSAPPYDDAPVSATDPETHNEEPLAVSDMPSAEGADGDSDGDSDGDPDTEGSEAQGSNQPTGSWIPDFVASKEKVSEDNGAEASGAEASWEEAGQVRDTDIAALYPTGELSAIDGDEDPAGDDAEATAGEPDTVNLAEGETASTRERSRALFWRNES